MTKKLKEETAKIEGYLKDGSYNLAFGKKEHGHGENFIPSEVPKNDEEEKKGE